MPPVVTKRSVPGNPPCMFDLTITGAIARLRLNRPETRNAVPLSGWGELATHAAAAGSSARILLVGAKAEGAFCAGADIADFPRFQEDAAARTAFREAIRHGLDTLRGLAIPTVAMVDGACYGAGVALAMACDIRIAGPAARFAITPAKLGIGYPQEDVHRLVSLVGPGHAARLLFGAGAIDGEEAVRIGLAELMCEDVEAAAGAFADTVAANDPESIAMLKRGIALAESAILRDEVQDRAFDALLGSEALVQRLAAYRARPK